MSNRCYIYSYDLQITITLYFVIIYLLFYHSSALQKAAIMYISPPNNRNLLQYRISNNGNLGNLDESSLDSIFSDK